jgi:hypothetical protein
VVSRGPQVWCLVAGGREFQTPRTALGDMVTIGGSPNLRLFPSFRKDFALLRKAFIRDVQDRIRSANKTSDRVLRAHKSWSFVKVR